jgi:hypothetical protein
MHFVCFVEKGYKKLLGEPGEMQMPITITTDSRQALTRDTVSEAIIAGSIKGLRRGRQG